MSARLRWIIRLAKSVLVCIVVICGTVTHQPAYSESSGSCFDSELGRVMLRAGKEAFGRGKYSLSLSYFKRAIQADSTSEKAWRWYNVTLSYALAEQSKKITYPDLRHQENSIVPQATEPSKTVPAHPEPPGSVDDEDEGIDEYMDGC